MYLLPGLASTFAEASEDRSPPRQAKLAEPPLHAHCIRCRMSICVSHFPQTRSVAPAATFARVRLRNFCWRKRPIFLASRRFASGIPDTCSHC